jgi:ketosteroid isomerase-like protein
MPEAEVAAGASLDARDFAVRVFADVDRMESSRLGRYLAEDCELRFANSNPVAGRAAIEQALTAFLAGIRENQGVERIAHEILGAWRAGDVVFVDLRVTYHLADGREIDLPGAVMWRMRGELIAGYKIFVDHGPLWAA